MVFESVVVDVLNRFLGDYVVNLDKSQLNLGIWAGNETAAAPLSRLPPGIPLPEPGPAFVGPRAPRCHLPPPSLGSDYIEPGGSCWASAGKLFFLAGGEWGLGCGMKRAPFFR